MAKVQLQIKGIEALKKKLMERREIMINYLTHAMSELGERAVTYSKDNKGYQDHTANLKNSISFALYLDGVEITSQVGKIPKADEAEGGQEAVQSVLNQYVQKEGVIAPKGYSLIVIAGMNYGKYVEDKGYNVLYLTRYFLKDEMKKIILEAVENAKQSN